MQIDHVRQGQTLIIKLSGRLETSTAPGLQEIVEKELDDITELNIDMAELEYVSSAGLRVLLAAAKRMKAQNGVMIVQHVNEEVMEVFEITGFKDILNIR